MDQKDKELREAYQQGFRDAYQHLYSLFSLFLAKNFPHPQVDSWTINKDQMLKEMQKCHDPS